MFAGKPMRSGAATKKAEPKPRLGKKEKGSPSSSGEGAPILLPFHLNSSSFSRQNTQRPLAQHLLKIVVSLQHQPVHGAGA